MEYEPKKKISHGDGLFSLSKLSKVGKDCVFERGIWLFHPENIEIGNNVYIGHDTFLKGYYKNKMKIGDNSWIGQQCFIWSAGGIIIGKNVGIAPKVSILTGQHREESLDKPILFCEQEFQEVVIEDDVDIGIGSIILPGVRIGKGSIIGAGAVVTKDVEPYSIMVGVPAKLLRKR